MKFQEVISRITGFSIPIFGVSWNPPQPEVTTARRILAFFEDRRVLYNPYNLEVADQCFSSVIEIRKFLTEVIGQLNLDSKLGDHLRAIRVACRAFLDNTNPKSRRILRHHSSLDSDFFTALGELRASIGLRIAAIVVMYGLDVEGDLESIIPTDSTMD